MSSDDSKKSTTQGRAAVTSAPNPASQPHGTTQDQVNEMESEGQATKPGQPPSPASSESTQIAGQKVDKRKA